MYAFFAEHTNISPKDLGQYTLEQIEFMMNGFNKNNSQSDSNVIDGMDAINALMQGKI